MRLLLDTHIMLRLFDDGHADIGVSVLDAMRSKDASLFVSVASLWEIAIKCRLGKLRLAFPLNELADVTARLCRDVLAVTAEQATVDVDPWPPTNDPFDRLLLAVCHADGMRLLTMDAKLMDHPLAWRSAA